MEAEDPEMLARWPPFVLKTFFRPPPEMQRQQDMAAEESECDLREPRVSSWISQNSRKRDSHGRGAACCLTKWDWRARADVQMGND